LLETNEKAMNNENVVNVEPFPTLVEIKQEKTENGGTWKDISHEVVAQLTDKYDQTNMHYDESVDTVKPSDVEQSVEQAFENIVVNEEKSAKEEKQNIPSPKINFSPITEEEPPKVIKRRIDFSAYEAPNNDSVRKQVEVATQKDSIVESVSNTSTPKSCKCSDLYYELTEAIMKLTMMQAQNEKSGKGNTVIHNHYYS
jgi:hypothetical protein